MEKSDLMIEYEIRIDSIVNWESTPVGYTRYLESELIKARSNANITDETIEKFQEIIRNQCDEISTLKEKAEAYDRLTSKEPCEFCVNNSTKELEHNGFKITCYSTHYGYAELQVESPEHDGTGDFEINYCPMCGRNLGDEE